MKDIHASYPVQLAEYTIQWWIDQKPAFAWWIPYVMKKKNRIISKKTKSKYWTTTHKFGICLPHSVDEAKKIDVDNGNTVWWDAICKEMKNVRVAFEKYDGSMEELIAKSLQTAGYAYDL